MEGSRFTRYIRIAVTALSLTACVLLVALWVRSYCWCDSMVVQLSRTNGLGVSSIEGRILLKYSAHWDTQITTWKVFSVSMSEELRDFVLHSWPSFGITWDSGSVEGAVRHWCLTVLTAAIAAASWTCGNWRFSLSTLLIAMTLVAVGLGIIVVAM
jgi:hypothetical protein